MGQSRWSRLLYDGIGKKRSPLSGFGGITGTQFGGKFDGVTKSGTVGSSRAALNRGILERSSSIACPASSLADCEHNEEFHIALVVDTGTSPLLDSSLPTFNSRSHLLMCNQQKLRASTME